MHNFHDNHFPIASGNFLHFSNSLKVARMEMKLGTHAYYITSMTNTYFSDDYILFRHSLFKLAAHYIISMMTTGIFYPPFAEIYVAV